MLVCADARALPLPDSWVQTVVTSPPYWGLRDYGLAQWVGGDPACDHKVDTAHQKQGATSQRAGRSNVEEQRNENFRDVCDKCGGRRIDQSIGLEGSPDLYVASLVEVFREVWRVLRDDGTVWLNLGDSYATQGGPGIQGVTGQRADRRFTAEGSSAKGVPFGLKSKDLVGIPWRVAFALQAAGWYLRSDIIWAKPNPMPESVLDRPTRSHEYVFLLTKRPRYYYDAEGVREASTERRSGNGRRKLASGAEGQRVNDHLGSSIPYTPDGSGRNRRSVWTITPKPFRGAHFATFPPELVEPCLLAGSSPYACAACGSPYRRVVERGQPLVEQQIACGSNAAGEYLGVATKDFAGAAAQDASAVKARILAGMVGRTTRGWQPTCACDAAPVQSVVLDPFCGSGTTGMVAVQHGRFFVGVDRKPTYLTMAAERIATAVPVGLPPVILPR